MSKQRDPAKYFIIKNTTHILVQKNEINHVINFNVQSMHSN